jgi:phage anti-repressor protein
LGFAAIPIWFVCSILVTHAVFVIGHLAVKSERQRITNCIIIIIIIIIIIMKYMRITAGYTSTDHKTNTEIAKELNITTALGKTQHCKRKWIKHVDRMRRNGLPRIIKKLHTKRRKEPGKTHEETSGCE